MSSEVRTGQWVRMHQEVFNLLLATLCNTCREEGEGRSVATEMRSVLSHVTVHGCIGSRSASVT